MIVESGEQSSLYLIQRGTVRKQIKLAAIVVFVSLPGEKEQTLYIVLTKAQEILEPFYFWKVIESRKINVKNILNRIIYPVQNIFVIGDYISILGNIETIFRPDCNNRALNHK